MALFLLVTFNNDKNRPKHLITLKRVLPHKQSLIYIVAAVRKTRLNVIKRWQPHMKSTRLEILFAIQSWHHTLSNDRKKMKKKIRICFILRIISRLLLLHYVRHKHWCIINKCEKHSLLALSLHRKQFQQQFCQVWFHWLHK